MVKQCTLCTRTLPLTSFVWRRDREAYTTRCKQCQQAHARQYWHTRMANIAPDPKADEVRELNACADGWSYESRPASLAWRV